jgi:uncharacterized membrane protein YkvI
MAAGQAARLRCHWRAEPHSPTLVTLTKHPLKTRIEPQRPLTNLLGSPSHPTMWSLKLYNVDAVTLYTIAAVLCTLVAQRLFSRQSEFCSEILSWIILPILFKITSTPAGENKHTSNVSELRSTSSRSLWIVATCLAVSCWYKAENGIVELLVSNSFEMTSVPGANRP